MENQIIVPEGSASQLMVSVNGVQAYAEAIIVSNDAEYQTAAAFGKDLKAKSGEVKAFFSPFKEAANAAHKAICDKEKQTLAPLEKAEAALKKTMGVYLQIQEEKRRAAEAEARRKLQEEAEKKLQEAIALEEAGKQKQADSQMKQAEIAQTLAMREKDVVPTMAPKVSGVSSTKDWEILSVDDSLVPVSVAGVNIRPVDTSAVMRMIRASKGTVQIPGVVYKETIRMNIGR